MAVDHEQRQPVVGGALSESHGQHDGPDRKEPSVLPHLRAGGPGGVRSGRRGTDSGPGGHGTDGVPEDRCRHRGHRQEVPVGGERRSGGRHAGQAADDGAQAEAPVQRGQYRRAGDPFHVGTVHIDRHLTRPDPRAEHAQPRGDQGRGAEGAARAHDNHAGDDEQGGERRHGSGPEPRHETAGTENACHRADGQTEQHQPHLPRGQAQTVTSPTEYEQMYPPGR